MVRFAADLHHLAGVKATVDLSPEPTGLHVVQVGGVDFFFRADGSGYDGWGMALTEKGLNFSRRAGNQPENPG